MYVYICIFIYIYTYIYKYTSSIYICMYLQIVPCKIISDNVAISYRRQGLHILPLRGKMRQNNIREWVKTHLWLSSQRPGYVSTTPRAPARTRALFLAHALSLLSASALPPSLARPSSCSLARSISHSLACAIARSLARSPSHPPLSQSLASVCLLQWVVVLISFSRCGAVWCGVVQCGAVCCSELQCCSLSVVGFGLPIALLFSTLCSVSWSLLFSPSFSPSPSLSQTPPPWLIIFLISTPPSPPSISHTFSLSHTHTTHKHSRPVRSCLHHGDWSSLSISLPPPQFR